MKKIILSIFLVVILNFAAAGVSYAEEVIFDIKTKLIHQENCPYIKKHSINTTKVEREVAEKRGGKNCPHCGKIIKKITIQH